MSDGGPWDVMVSGTGTTGCLVLALVLIDADAGIAWVRVQH